MPQANQLRLSPQHINAIVFIILGLFPLLGMGIDLIAPSLPAISDSLYVSHTFSKNLITIYFLGYILGNIFSGFLSDVIGRRFLLINGLLIFTFASLLPIFFVHIKMLMLARFLQGVSISVFAVVSRAVLSDVLETKHLIRAATLLSTMWGIGPVIGPFIGGYLQYYFDWQACFYFFALYSGIGFIATYFVIPETNNNRQLFDLRQIKNNFITIITHHLFLGLVTLMGLAYSLLMVFNTLGPFLIQDHFGYSSIYFGRIALCMGFVFLLGTLVCRRLIQSFEPEKILLFVIPIFLVVSLIGLMVAYLNEKSIVITIALSLLMFFGSGIIYPTCMGKGLALFRHLAGSGSAVMNLVNISLTALTAFLMSFINAASLVPIAWIYFGLTLLCFGTYWFLVHPNKEG